MADSSNRTDSVQVTRAGEISPTAPPESPQGSPGAIPHSDTQNARNGISGPPEPFEPQSWLAAFEAVGGGWVLRDQLSLMWQIEGRSIDDQLAAGELIQRLSADDRKALIAFLRPFNDQEVRHG